MGLTVTVLGSCGSYPRPGDACSGYLVRTDTTVLWVDAGSGTLANLQRHASLSEVDAILLSHEHPDHWLDLHGYYIACKYYLHRTVVPVYAPAGLRDHAYYRDQPIEWHDVADGDAVRVGDVTVTFSRTDHKPETLGMRLEGGGRALGYSADSGPAWSLEALGEPLDLAICEATLTTEEEGTMRHMSARQAGRSARDARARRLVLTHFGPTVDRGRARDEGAGSFGDEVETARAGAEYVL